MTYCVVPHDLAPKLHDALRRFYRHDPSVEVIVERRASDRRARRDRRSAGDPAAAEERRRIRNVEGRRVGDRRATQVGVDPPPLPRKALPHLHRLVFVERLEPSEQHLEDLDTARLVMRIQAGDRNAFGELYMRYFDRVYSYLQVVFDDSHEAEDATQQVFTQVFEALPGYERRARQPFRAWLFVVVRNLAVTRMRKRHRMDVVDPEDLREPREQRHGEDDPDVSVLDWISDRELLLFVERLPLAQRQVLLLRYMLDLSDRQIAPILGRTPSEVRVLQYRALSFLRERLAAIGRHSASGRRAQHRRRFREAPVLRQRRFAMSP